MSEHACCLCTHPDTTCTRACIYAHTHTCTHSQSYMHTSTQPPTTTTHYTYTHLLQSVVHSLSRDSSLQESSEATESELSPPTLPACSAKDRALLLALALKWRRESKTSTLSPEQLQEFEREIWVEHIRAAMEASNVSVVCVVICRNVLLYL